MKLNYILILILIIIILIGFSSSLSYLSTSTQKLSLKILSNRFINKNIKNIHEGFIGSCNKFNNGVSDPVYNSNNPDYCPDSLFYDGYIYRLYKNGDVIQAFNNYSDYVRYHNFMSVNYSTKGITCKPLTPINQGSFRPDSERDVFLNPSNVLPREYNIENFTNPTSTTITNSTTPITSTPSTTPSTTSTTTAPNEINSLSPSQRIELNKITEEYTKLLNDYFKTSMTNLKCSIQGDLYKGLSAYVIFQIEKKIGEKIKEVDFAQLGEQQFTPITKQIPIIDRAKIILEIIRTLPACSDLVDFTQETKTIGGLTSGPNTLLSKYTNQFVQKEVIAAQKPMCMNINELLSRLSSYVIFQIEKKINGRIKERSLLDLPADNNFTILSINNSTVIPTYSLTDKQKIVEDILSTLPSCEIIMNFDYQTASAAATTQTIAKSETLYTLEEARKKIEELYVEYLMKNKDCVDKIMDKTSEFSEKFKKSYELYLQEQLTASLGYLPMKSDLSKMTQKEIQVYIGILSNIPNCNSLIAKYFPSTISKPSTGIPVAIAPQGRSGAWNVSIVPPSDSKISISSQTLGGGMEIDAVIKENRGEVKADPQGDRKTTPPSAPYWNHLANIGKYLQDVALTNLIKNNTTTENTDLPDILRQKYLEEDRKMKEQIEKERLEDEKNIKELAKKTEEKYYATSPDIDWKDPKYHLKGTMADNFAFSPDYTNKHMEPDLKSAGAYGWSFVPPQFWSVPQKRPPVCIPSKGTEAKVVPVYDQSVPLDALEWSKVLPEVVYDRDYNPDYWAPGWKFQDQANYPNFTKSKNFSTEYYNYNRAMPTSK